MVSLKKQLLLLTISLLPPQDLEIFKWPLCDTSLLCTVTNTKLLATNHNGTSYLWSNWKSFVGWELLFSETQVTVLAEEYIIKWCKSLYLLILIHILLTRNHKLQYLPQSNRIWLNFHSRFTFHSRVTIRMLKAETL